MGCCGESRDPPEDKQIQSEPTPYFVNHQPSPHPGAVYPNSYTPITTPPPTQYPNYSNGYVFHKFLDCKLTFPTISLFSEIQT